jgi:hypothetical protein
MLRRARQSTRPRLRRMKRSLALICRCDGEVGPDDTVCPHCREPF